MSAHAWRIRRASAADAPAVLAIFDSVIEWFVEIGNTEQWGTEPWSTSERQVRRVADECALPGAWLAEHPEAGVVGALVLGDPVAYAPPAAGPERYVRLLIASRDPRARGVGRHLLDFAAAEARAAGAERLRVDCYCGGDQALVRFYESCGYVRGEAFDENGWPGRFLSRTLGAPQAEGSGAPRG